MSLLLYENHEFTVFKIADKLDQDNYEEVFAAVQDCIERRKYKIAFDLSQINYINSTGLKLFLETVKALKGKAGEKFCLFGLTPAVKNILDKNKITTVIKNIYLSKDEFEIDVDDSVGDSNQLLDEMND